MSKRRGLLSLITGLALCKNPIIASDRSVRQPLYEAMRRYTTPYDAMRGYKTLYDASSR